MKLQTVVLDAFGDGDATSLRQALSLVASDGDIEVEPGAYDVDGVVISTSVRILGATTGSPPILRGELKVLSGDVALEGVTLASKDNDSALTVRDGQVSIYNSRVESGVPRATAWPLISTYHSDLDIRLTIVSAASGSAIQAMDGRTVVKRSTLAGETTAAQIVGGSLVVEDSTLQGKTVIYANGGEMTLTRNSIRSTEAFEMIGVVAKNNAVATVVGNVFYNFSIGAWYCDDATVRSTVRGNSDPDGAPERYYRCPLE